MHSRSYASFFTVLVAATLELVSRDCDTNADVSQIRWHKYYFSSHDFDPEGLFTTHPYILREARTSHPSAMTTSLPRSAA